jgi:phosphoribosylformylglycinamidine synthase
MPIEVLLGKPPKMLRDVAARAGARGRALAGGVDLREAALRVLRLPAVADKTFLVTIGDRSVGGLTRATRWSAPGRCRWPMSRSRPPASTA